MSAYGRVEPGRALRDVGPDLEHVRPAQPLVELIRASSLGGDHDRRRRPAARTATGCGCPCTGCSWPRASAAAASCPSRRGGARPGARRSRTARAGPGTPACTRPGCSTPWSPHSLANCRPARARSGSRGSGRSARSSGSASCRWRPRQQLGEADVGEERRDVPRWRAPCPGPRRATSAAFGTRRHAGGRGSGSGSWRLERNATLKNAAGCAAVPAPPGLRSRSRSLREQVAAWSPCPTARRPSRTGPWPPWVPVAVGTTTWIWRRRGRRSPSARVRRTGAPVAACVSVADELVSRTG